MGWHIYKAYENGLKILLLFNTWDKIKRKMPKVFSSKIFQKDLIQYFWSVKMDYITLDWEISETLYKLLVNPVCDFRHNSSSIRVDLFL